MDRETRLNPEIIKTANMLWNILVIGASVYGFIWLGKWSYIFLVTHR